MTIYGIEVCKKFVNYFEAAMNSGDSIDTRYCRAFLEHKKLIMRLKYIIKYEYIVDSEIVKNLSVKFNISRNIKIIKRIINILNNLIDQEFLILNNVLKYLMI